MQAREWESERQAWEAAPTVTEGDRQRLAERFSAAIVEGWSDAEVLTHATASGLLPPSFPEHPPGALQALERPSAEDLEWLMSSLACGQRRRYVAHLARSARIPEELFEPFLQAALEAGNLSETPAYLAPCMRDFSPERVHRWLLDRFEAGTEEEALAAVNALYWAQSSELSAATKSRERRLFLRRFLESSNPTLRESLMASLDCDPDHYAPSERELLAQVIARARSDPRDEVRERLQMQLEEAAFQRARGRTPGHGPPR